MNESLFSLMLKRKNTATRMVVIIIAVLCLLPACHRLPDPDASQSEADKALRTALEAWKNGKSQADLEKENPSIIMNEDDWRTGKQLLDYKMEASALSG